MTETQQRFLRAIAERLPKEQVVEVHLFPAIRQSGVETGVAIVAERPRALVLEAETSSGNGSGGPGGAVVADDTDADIADALDDTSSADAPSAAWPRLTVHTARYRLTLKGVDRGKWEVDVVAEADAPLSAVDAVVRGVQRRAGEGAEPDRLTAEAFRDALDAPLASLER